MTQMPVHSEDIETVLAEHSLFCLLPAEARRALVSKCTVNRLSRGDKLIEKDKFNYHLYLIREGSADVVMNGEIVGKLESGDVAGEISASGLSTPVADVVAGTSLEVIAFPIEDVDDIALEHLEFAEKMREIGSERFGY